MLQSPMQVTHDDNLGFLQLLKHGQGMLQSPMQVTHDDNLGFLQLLARSDIHNYPMLEHP
jgi:hypothetical protein